MTTKNLELKLTIDTSGLLKVSKEIENQEKAINKVSALTDKLSAIEQHRLDISKELAPVYERLNGIITKANEAIATGSSYATLALGNTERAVNKVNTSYASQLKTLQDLKDLSDRMKVSSSLGANLGTSSLSTRYSARPSAEEQTFTTPTSGYSGLTKASIEAKLIAVKKGEDAIITMQEHTARKEKEILDRATFEATAAYNARAVAYSNLFKNIPDIARTQIGTGGTGYGGLTATPVQEAPGTSAARQAALAAGHESERQARLAELRLIEEFNRQTAFADSEGLRKRTEGLQAQRNIQANLYREQTSLVVNELNRRVALEESIRVNGVNSIRTIELRAAQDEETIRKNLANKILQIEENLRSGVIANRSNATSQRSSVISQAEAQINALRTALRVQQETEAESQRLHSITVQRFASDTQEQITTTRASIAIRTAEEIHGIDSIQVQRLRAAEQTRQIERNLQAQLNLIHSNVSGRLITPQAGNAQVAAATAEYSRAITENTASLRRNEEALSSNVVASRNFIVRVLEFIGLYRVFNTIINTVITSLKAIPNIGIELEATRSSLEATIGSTVGMGSAMAALNREADRTGISITTLRSSFRLFQASTSLAGESLDSTWHMFTNLNTVITGLHMPADAANGVFLAMAQIFNKTKVQSEELVKQLGNLLPGAFASFQKANADMFKNSADLIAKMKNGVVFAHDTVEKFTDYLANRFGIAFETASQGLNASLGRLDTSFTHLGEAIYGKTGGTLVEFIKGLTKINEAIVNDINGANRLGEVLTVALNVALIATVGWIGKLVGGLIATRVELLATAAATAEVSKATYLLNASMEFLRSPGTIIAGIGLISLAYVEQRNKIKDVEDEIIRLRDLEQSKSKANTPEEKIQFEIVNDAAVKSAQRNLDIVADRLAGLQTLQKVLFGRKASFTSSEDVAKEKALVLEAQKQLDNALKTAREKIELRQLGESVALEEAKEKTIYEVHLAYLEKIKTADAAAAAAELKFDKANAERKAELLKIASKGVPLKDIAQVEEADKAKGLLKELEFTRQATIAEARETYASKTAKVETEINKSFIREVKAEARLALADLEAQQTDLDQKYSRHLVSINTYYKEKLRIAEEIYAVESRSINREKLAITSKSEISLDTKGLDSANKNLIDALRTSSSSIKDSIANNLVRVNEKYGSIISSASKTTGVSPELIKAVLSVESGGNTKAISSKGATGLMQIVPASHPEFDRTRLANDVSYNIESGAKELARLIKIFPDNLIKVISAYNAGEGATKSGKASTYPETQNYVNRVTTGLSLQGVQVPSKALVRDLENESKIYELEDKQLSLDLKQEQVRKSITLAEKYAIIDYNKSVSALLLEKAKISGVDLEQIGYENALLQTADQRLQIEGRLADIAQELENAYRSGDKVKVAQLSVDKIRNQTALIQLNLDTKVAGIKDQLALTTNQETLAEANLQSVIKAVDVERELGITTAVDGANRLQQARQPLLVLLQKEIELNRKKLALNKDDIQAQLDIIALQSKIEEKIFPSAGLNASSMVPEYVKAFQTDQSNTAKSLADEKAKADYTFANTQDTLQGPPGQQDYTLLTTTKQKAEENARTKGLEDNLKYYGAISSMATTHAEKATAAITQMYGAHSKAARAAFVVQKAFAIASAIINTAEGATKALAQGGIIGAATAAIVIAAGAAEVAAIVAQQAPQAHAGLDYVPENNQTYLLSKGERVLAPQQNKDLTNYLNKSNMGGTSGKPTSDSSNTNIRIINTVDPSLMDEWAASPNGEKVIMNTVRRNKG